LSIKYGLLVLEGSWEDEESMYLTDFRSATRFYLALEDILSEIDKPIKFISRPLLTYRFDQDISEFVSMTIRKAGGTVIILSAHGSQIRTRKGKRRRILEALDGELNLSAKLLNLTCNLKKTILILDSCDLGVRLASLKRRTNALGIIGFQQSVDWVDSALFIMAFIYKLASENFFSTKKELKKVAERAIDSMLEPPYKEFINYLEVEMEFD